MAMTLVLMAIVVLVPALSVFVALKAGSRDPWNIHG